MLKIKNKRAIEDKIVDITLNENKQKSAGDSNSKHTEQVAPNGKQIIIKWVGNNLYGLVR